MPQHLPEEMLTLEQCATLLQIHPKTLRRYLAQHAIEFCVLNPHSKRHQIRIARSALEAFIRKNTQCLPSPERPKRVYHREFQKYKRKKKAAKKRI